MLDLSRDLLVRGANLVPLGLWDLLEDQVLRGLLGLLERKEFLWVCGWVCFLRRLPSSDTSVTKSALTSALSPRVRKARLAQLDVMDCRVPWVCLAQLDHPEYQGRMEIRCSPQLPDCELQSRASDGSCFPDVALTFSAMVFLSAGWGWRARSERCQGRKRRACEWGRQPQAGMVLPRPLVSYLYDFLCVGRVLRVHLDQWVQSASLVLQ